MTTMTPDSLPKRYWDTMRWLVDEVAHIRRREVKHRCEDAEEIARLDVRVARLEAIIERSAYELQELAFEIPSPNPVTPQLVELAVTMRNEARK